MKIISEKIKWLTEEIGPNYFGTSWSRGDEFVMQRRVLRQLLKDHPELDYAGELFEFVRGVAENGICECELIFSAPEEKPKCEHCKAQALIEKIEKGE